VVKKAVVKQAPHDSCGQYSFWQAFSLCGPRYLHRALYLYGHCYHGPCLHGQLCHRELIYHRESVPYGRNWLLG
ncbi:hypothetical protein ACSMDK_18285, partial [Yersinia enterocolitica]